LWCDTDAYGITNCDCLGHANRDRNGHGHGNCYGHANSDRYGDSDGHAGMPDSDHAIDEPDDNEWQLSLVQRRLAGLLPR
jgi:hypothetical protein